MKKIFILSIIFAFLVTLVAPVTAEDKPIDTPRNGSKAAEKRIALAETSMERLKERAEKEINRRIESLNKLIIRIGEMKKLTDAQKASLTSQVQTEITKLNTLLTKIQADTDLETLKADVKSIVDSYRIYALFIPRIQIIGAADRILNITDKMGSQAATLELKITDAKNGGSDTTELESLLADMKANIESAKTNAQGAIDLVMPLTPDGFPGNKTALQSARKMVVEALHDLNEARQDARKIIVGLMKLGKISTSPTTEPTL